jgi:hypothetical protein
MMMQGSDFKTEIKRLILNSAPEKEAELDKLWETYSFNFFEAKDKPGYTLEAGPWGIILSNERSRLRMWLLGFAAQAAFMGYGQLLVASLLFRECSLSDVQLVETESYDTLIRACCELGAVESLSHFHWPSGIPDPNRRQPTDISNAFAYKVNGIAFAYSFLHEIQHVRFRQESNAPPTLHEEELECDRFARDFLLKDVQAYASKSGDALGTVKNFRATGIGVAFFFLLELSDCWAESTSHPSLRNRLTALADSLTLPDDDMFWIHLSSLLLAQLRFAAASDVSGITSSSPRAVCLELIGRLTDSSPQTT